MAVLIQRSARKKREEELRSGHLTVLAEVTLKLSPIKVQNEKVNAH